MKSLVKYIPKVEKKTLLLIAGMVWGFAGFKVLNLGIQDVSINNGKFISNLIFAGLVFYIFFKFIFSKIYNKHTRRIVNSQLEKQCIFSFFDVKSYCIMGVMIFLGKTIRNLEIFNPIYVGNFYIGLGFALFVAGVLFIMSSLKFELTKLKYNN
ncbi:hypothetical protein [Clostridium weizhouense]|uniref:DUF3278 domain-containing protein n=1 Tax=Clostridium weizhouense TaxID=2859781 RepID=A0ABS7AL09_9CLOT|nr:hypothetical protein [Clostridium weizhouense]MBW6409091.1 hypothetical protein [Clostridium weizhouense]